MCRGTNKNKQMNEPITSISKKQLPDNYTKKPYCTPHIEQIKLDYEISLLLESLQPDGEPDWSKAAEHSTANPFKTNVV